MPLLPGMNIVERQHIVGILGGLGMHVDDHQGISISFGSI